MCTSHFAAEDMKKTITLGLGFNTTGVQCCLVEDSLGEAVLL